MMMKMKSMTVLIRKLLRRVRVAGCVVAMAFSIGVIARTGHCAGPDVGYCIFLYDEAPDKYPPRTQWQVRMRSGVPYWSSLSRARKPTDKLADLGRLGT